jgi:hypothetical protein
VITDGFEKSIEKLPFLPSPHSSVRSGMEDIPKPMRMDIGNCGTRWRPSRSAPASFFPKSRLPGDLHALPEAPAGPPADAAGPV